MTDKTLLIQLPCEPKQVREARKSLRDFCLDLSFSEEDIGNIELALNEGVSNAIDHGSSANRLMFIEIEFMTRGKWLIITITDHGGREFNPEYYERITLKKDWGHGGRGIYLMKTIMDEVSYVFSPGHYTLLYLSKRLP